MKTVYITPSWMQAVTVHAMAFRSSEHELQSAMTEIQRAGNLADGFQELTRLFGKWEDQLITETEFITRSRYIIADYCVKDHKLNNYVVKPNIPLEAGE